MMLFYLSRMLSLCMLSLSLSPSIYICKKKKSRILANARQGLSSRKHDFLTHPFTPPIPPSLPAIAAGVLGGGAPDSLPLICVPLPFGGAHTTLTGLYT
jgi:hypothetical protein